MQNNIVAVQEREPETAWSMKRIHCRIVCVYRWYTNGVIGNLLLTIQGQMLLNSANVSTTNLMFIGGEDVGP